MSRIVFAERTYRVRGRKPLLLNPMSSRTLRALWDKNNAAAQPKLKFESPEAEAASKVLTDASGNPYVPAEYVLACLVGAGVLVPFAGKRNLSTTKSSFVPAFVDIVDLQLPLVSSAGAPSTWVTDMRRGVNPHGGEAVVIVRPRFDDWGFEITTRYISSMLSAAKLDDLLETAGIMFGLGDFRPQKKGSYGTFTVELLRASGEDAPVDSAAAATVESVPVEDDDTGEE